MRLMGALLAGGQARRFGSDKALALLDGKPLLAHVADALAPQVATLVIVGRDWENYPRVDDAPAGVGPLGGLCAALAYAHAHGFDAVVSAGCDVVPLPQDLVKRLQQGADGRACVAQGQWLLGYWPVSLASDLAAHLKGTQDYAIRNWMRACDAQTVDLGIPLTNINRPQDLAALSGSALE